MSTLAVIHSHNLFDAVRWMKTQCEEVCLMCYLTIGPSSWTLMQVQILWMLVSAQASRPISTTASDALVSTHQCDAEA